MCSPCYAGCGGCCDCCDFCRGCNACGGCGGCGCDCVGGGCGNCCYSKPLAISKNLPRADDYRWFERCASSSCVVCQTNEDHECACICRRNRHIIEALTCLFNSTIPYILSVLFKLAFQQNKPMKRFPRDRNWDVMEHVKAPYTELNDLEIYDSMYDRCGLPTNPLHSDNIYKIVRMMFLISVLTIDQQKYLHQMLQRLNAHAHRRVDLDLLLRTLEGIDLKELICSIRNQETLVRSLYTARQCNDLCKLYQKVVTVDKNAVKRRRKRLKYGEQNVNRNSDAGQIEETVSARQTALNRQFCVRKPQDFIFSGGSPNGITPSTGRNRNSTFRTRSVSDSRNPSRSSKQHN